MSAKVKQCSFSEKKNEEQHQGLITDILKIEMAHWNFGRVIVKGGENEQLHL